MRAFLFSLLVLALALAATPASAHEELLRQDLRELAAGADLVARGRVVLVEADRGSRGPRQVSVLVGRVLQGELEAAALTFRAPPEHGPGWAVGDHAIFFLRRGEAGWLAAGLAAESPLADGKRGEGLDRQWEAALQGQGAAAAAGLPIGRSDEKESISLPGLLAGALCFAGLIGWRFLLLRVGRIV